MRTWTWMMLVTVVAIGCGSERTTPKPSSETALLPEHTSSTPAPESRSTAAPELDLPATYSGVLPCADCPGIDVTLNLYAENTFVRRQVYRDRPDGRGVDVGTFTVSDEGVLNLSGSPRQQRMYEIDSTGLRSLDLRGEKIESDLPYTLDRAQTVLSIEEPISLTGMYLYFADAGRLSECLTGMSFPVAMELENATLESEYLAVRKTPGAPAFVSLDAYFDLRPVQDGDGSRLMIIPVRLDRFWPDQSGCP